MAPTIAPDIKGDELARRLETTLREFNKPHPTAGKFLRDADNATACQRHVMLSVRHISSVGCMPPPAQKYTAQYIMANLENALEPEPCWPKLKPVIHEHLQDFSVPPQDCQAQASSLVSSFTTPVGKYTAGCRQPATANAMQAEALGAIMEATEHIIVSVAGKFVQYSLTSRDFRPRYSARLLSELRIQMDAIQHLDQNCAFALHAVDRWKNVDYHDDTLAKLMLWGDRVNAAAFHVKGPEESRSAALIMARRRLGTTVEVFINQENPPTQTERGKACEIAAYWVEVTHNLTPTNTYAKRLYEIDDIPDLSPNSDF